MAATEWIVEKGDNIWDIAAKVHTMNTGVQPSLEENVQGMQQIIAANIGQLKGGTPGPADLIIPGQKLMIPGWSGKPTPAQAAQNGKGKGKGKGQPDTGDTYATQPGRGGTAKGSDTTGAKGEGAKPGAEQNPPATGPGTGVEIDPETGRPYRLLNEPRPSSGRGLGPPPEGGYYSTQPGRGGNPMSPVGPNRTPPPPPTRTEARPRELTLAERYDQRVGQEGAMARSRGTVGRPEYQPPRPRRAPEGDYYASAPGRGGNPMSPAAATRRGQAPPVRPPTTRTNATPRTYDTWEQERAMGRTRGTQGRP